MTALHVVGAESGSVLLADPDKKELLFRHCEGRSRLEPGAAMPWDRGIAGHVFQTVTAVVIHDVKRDARHYADIDARLNHVTRDLIVVPLKRWQGEPIGVLEVLNKRRGRFDRQDLALLTVVSAAAASSIERAYWYEEAKLAEVVRFLGNVSHDVKNLLVPVSLGAGVLEGRVDSLYTRMSPSDQAQSNDDLEAVKAVTRMLRLSSQRIEQQLRDIANCVKGLTTPPDFGPCRVAAIVEEVLATLRVSADEYGVTLGARTVDALPEIEADPHRLFNALYNLVSNAIDAMPRGGAVTVIGAWQRGGGEIELSVSDTGPGLPPQVREHLFTRRLRSTKSRGTGLGLKVVQDVVAAHGGRITVNSEGGVGTTFTLALPVRAPGRPR